MNSTSSILRIICGLAVIILSYTTYQNTFAHAAPGTQLQIFGMATGASAGQLTLGFVVIGLIGTALLALGVIGILKNRQ
jgi:TRAP-type C4-dicarboxylate transport system permease small subunit